MSFFYKLFGGDSKKKQVDAPPPAAKSEAEKIAEKKIKIEVKLNELDLKIKNYEEREKNFEYKIEILKYKAKELIGFGKEDDARKYVDEALEVLKQAQDYTRRKKCLVDKKFQLEQEVMDMETIGIFDSVDNSKDIIDKKIKIEASLNELDMKIKNFEEKEKIFGDKIQILTNKAKELIGIGKQEDAKKFMDEALELEKQADDYTLRKKVLIDKKFQLEQAIMDMETIEALENVSKHLKMQEMQSQKPVDIACEGFKVQWKKIDQLDSESDKQKAEKMFKELLREVKEGKEGKAKIETGKSVNLAVAPSETSKNVSEKEHEEETENMPANL